MLRILIASILSALLVVAAVSLLTLILPSEPAGEIKKPSDNIVLKQAEEDCQLIQAKVEKLRKLPSGGSCKEFDGCAMIGQSCSSVPKVEAVKTNKEFDRLFSKAKELNCNVGYLICEFAVASCKDNTCIVERAVLGQPEVPEL